MQKRQQWFAGIVAIVFLATGQVTVRAQGNFGVLHSFTGSTTDGSTPEGQPVLIGSNLFGVSEYGGSSSDGTLYRITTNGTGFAVLYSFTGGANGANPYSTLVSTGAFLYGMTFNGGVNDGGVVFGVNTNGTGYSVLHTFLGGGGDGQYPLGSLALNGSTLYGMTDSGGTNGEGVIFSLSTTSSTFSVLHSFAGSPGDGAFPYEGVIVSGTTLYGTTYYGGSNNVGLVFAYNTALSSNAFTILHHFAGGSADGANPTGPLTLDGTTLYGLTASGGTNSLGTVFKINTSGSGYSVLHSFTGATNDGALPQFGPLLITNSLVYGATEGGGISNNGVLFQMNADGTGFSLMHGFTGGATDGAYPAFGPLLIGSSLYGVTINGGTNNLGVVYGRSTPVTCSGTNGILTQVSAIQIVSNDVVITVPTTICDMYQLQYSDAMVPTNWTNTGSAVPGTGGPIQLIDFGAVGGGSVTQSVTWQIEGWPRNQNWGGPEGLPASLTNNEITLDGQDVLTVQSYTPPLMISYDVLLPNKTTSDGIIELFFVPPGVDPTLCPTNDVELLQFESQGGNDGMMVQTNTVWFYPDQIVAWGPVAKPLVPNTTYHYSVSVASGGLVSWSINGVDVGLTNSVVVPHPTFQLRLSSWQPTQYWYIKNFTVVTGSSAGVLQRFYRVAISP